MFLAHLLCVSCQGNFDYSLGAISEECKCFRRPSERKTVSYQRFYINHIIRDHVYRDAEIIDRRTETTNQSTLVPEEVGKGEIIDASVRDTKGQERPISPHDHRAKQNTRRTLYAE